MGLETKIQLLGFCGLETSKRGGNKGWSFHVIEKSLEEDKARGIRTT